MLQSMSGTTFDNYTKSESLYWLSNRHIIFPSKNALKRINHLIHKYPLDLVHRLFGLVNVEALCLSFLKNNPKNVTYNDVDRTDILLSMHGLPARQRNCA